VAVTPSIRRALLIFARDGPSSEFVTPWRDLVAARAQALRDVGAIS